MKEILQTKRALLAALSVGSLVALGAPALADGVVLSTQTNSATAAGGMTDADFDVSVMNTSGSAISDMSITFDDGSSVYIGDVAAGGAASAGPVSMSLNTAEMPTANFPVSVTLNYIQAAAVVEEASQITVSLNQ